MTSLSVFKKFIFTEIKGKIFKISNLLLHKKESIVIKKAC